MRIGLCQPLKELLCHLPLMLLNIIQRSISLRLLSGPIHLLRLSCRVNGSVEVPHIYMVHGGVLGFTFIDDFLDVHEGFEEVLRDGFLLELFLLEGGSVVRGRCTLLTGGCFRPPYPLRFWLSAGADVVLWSEVGGSRLQSWEQGTEAPLVLAGCELRLEVLCESAVGLMGGVRPLLNHVIKWKLLMANRPHGN